MFLSYYDPSDHSPELLVGREETLTWLTEGFDSYFEACRSDEQRGRTLGQTLCLLGDKGMGKSIIAQKLLRELYTRLSGSTMMLSIDCRNLRSLRDVITEIALSVQKELASLERSSVKVPRGLPEAAGILTELARTEKAELRALHERLLRFKGAMRLGTASQLIQLLDFLFGISLDVSNKELVSLRGEVNFDIPRLTKMLIAFFEEIRESGLNVFMLLDNVDEIRHSYRDPETRQLIRDETEWVLGLHKAPIGLLICMRTYYAKGLMTREIRLHKTLSRMKPAQLIEVVRSHMSRETQKVRDAFEQKTCQDLLTKLASMAPTPLALLTWFGWAIENDLLEEEVSAIAKDWQKGGYTAIEPGVLRQVLDAFVKAARNGRSVLSQKELLEALDGEESRLAQLQDLQTILPLDFWNPVDFTLDLELHWLVPGGIPHQN